VFLGFAGNAFDRGETLPLRPGQEAAPATLTPYKVHMNALTVTEDRQKQMITADITVSKNGVTLARMYPARHFYFGRENEPTTEVALRRGAAEDLHIVLAGYQVGDQEAQLQVKINPLVNWIWLGVGIMVFGTFIAFLPERAMAFATKRVPDDAATTTMIVLLLLGLTSSTLRAQHVEQSNTVFVAPKSQLEKDLNAHIVCMCGGCGRQRIGECTCPKAAEMRAKVAKLAAEGRNRDDIIQAFISEYGSQEVLGAPIDQGFNRIAWVLPYGVGLLSVAIVGGIALRWSRRRADGAPIAALASGPSRPDLEDRLDDELRELD